MVERMAVNQRDVSSNLAWGEERGGSRKMGIAVQAIMEG